MVNSYVLGTKESTFNVGKVDVNKGEESPKLKFNKKYLKVDSPPDRSPPNKKVSTPPKISPPKREVSPPKKFDESSIA